MAYSFKEGIPEKFQTDFDTGIFYQQEHLLIQSPQGLRSFVMMNESNKQIKAIVHFHIRGEIAWSPLRSPYGSYLFSKNISEEGLGEFVDFTESKLGESGVKSIILKSPPETYSPREHQLLNQVLMKRCYQADHEEMSAIIAVTDKSFESGLHRSEKKRLRKCRESDLVFTMASPDQLPVIYKFLRACKKKKGYVISMTLEELTKVFLVFPEHFFLSQVTLRDELVAANISIKVNESVLYNFYHDHRDAFDLLSPVVFLNEGLYRFCQQHGFKMLDLGTSMLQRGVNHSLLNFKLRLGALPSRKLILVKNIS